MDKNTSLYLRQALGWLGIILPFINGAAALLAGNSFIPSISGTHYMSSYAVFEPLVFAVGLYLLTYKGYDLLDRLLCSFAGVGAILLVLFPTSRPKLNTGDYEHLLGHNLFQVPEHISAIVHSVGAAMFFALLAVLLIFQFTKGDKTNPQKKKRNIVYYVCGGLMIGAIILVPFDGMLPTIKPFGVTFIAEAIALWAFGAAWLIKGEVLLKDK